MFKINRKIEYALMALKSMSEKRPGELTSAKEICESTEASFDVMARVLQILSQKQILKSEQGAHGGYLIQKDLNKISFLKLAEMILGPINIASCLHDLDHDCELATSCNIIPPMTKLNEKLKNFYETISVGELVQTQEIKRTRHLSALQTEFVV